MTRNLQLDGGGSDYMILLTILGTVPLVVMVILCACWKRTRQKDDLMGPPGIVTPKNPEENMNEITYNSVEQPFLNGLIRTDIVVDDVDSNIRPASLTKHRRSLPDIPNITNLQGHCDPNGDNSSDLYATLQPTYNTTGGSSLTDQQSSISQPDDPYSRVDNSNKKMENPYAVVNETNKLKESLNGEIDVQISSATKLLQPSTSASTSTAPPCQPPHIPPPLPSPTNSIGGLSTSIRISTNTNQQNQLDNNPVTENISAALAVQGDTVACQELPYITPPNVTSATSGPQENFSGDSQDSSKGYTSITVRAPLKDIIKDTYSDDSDEMYQTIPDANNIYTSGSETYAQIQPQIVVAVEINNFHLQEQAALDYSNETGAAVSTDKPHHGHSRQGSNSSSIQNLGSPKPEKRPANSPLPPPPSSSVATSSSNLDKPIQNVNDMYAKVNKKNKNPKDDNKNKNPPVQKIPTTAPLESQALDKKYVRKVEHNYETIKNSPKKSLQQNSLDSDPGYEKLQPRSSITEPGYESVNCNSTALELTDPNYEQLRPKSPTPSTSLILQTQTSGTSSVNSPNLTVDGYSVIRHNRRQSNQSSVSSDILTNTTTRNSVDEPNYESMPNSEHSDSVSCDLNDQLQPNMLNVEYKRLHNASEEGDSPRKDNSANSSQLEDLDPNYESLNKIESLVSNEEPNYESVKYDNVVNKVSGKQEVEGYDDGYEKIKKNSGKKDKCNSKGENPDYETVGKVADYSRENKRHLSGQDDIFEV